MAFEELFTEKLRPKKLAHIILPPRIRQAVENGLQCNLLLHSGPGTGKTSLAKILADPYDDNADYINISEQTGVDTVRDRIINFCSSVSLLGGEERHKVVILDEMDGASEAFFKAMRATMERFAKTTRFIGTANFFHKIPDYLQSRFTCINFEPASREEEAYVFGEYLKRVRGIFDRVGVKIEPDALEEFIRRNFPDMRSILNKVQDFHVRGIKEVRLDDIKTLNYSFRDIFTLVCGKPDPVSNYQALSEYASKVDDVLASLGSELPKWIRENRQDLVPKLPLIIVKAAHYQAQRSQVIDPLVSMLACCFEMQIIINS